MRQRILFVLMAICFMISSSVTYLAFGATNSIIIEGEMNGWVGANGLFLTIIGEDTSAVYKVSTNPNDNFDGFTDFVSHADRTPLYLEEGIGQYLYILAGNGDRRIFGPFTVDSTFPAISVVQESGQISYIIREDNLDFQRSGYTFSDSEDSPSFPENGFGSLHGFLEGFRFQPFLHFMLVDRAGNRTEQLVVVASGNAVDFLNFPNRGHCMITFSYEVDLTRTTYWYRNAANVFETRSVPSQSFDLWFPETGLYEIMINLVMRDGREEVITSPVYTISVADITPPVINIIPGMRGSTIVLRDTQSLVDTERSYIQSRGEVIPFGGTSSRRLNYDDFVVDLVRVVAYDRAGNVNTTVFVNESAIDVLVDIMFENGSYYLWAEGYTPVDSLIADAYGVYYLWDGVNPTVFERPDSPDIEFWIEDSVLFLSPIEFFYGMDSVEWNLLEPGEWDIASSFFQVNGVGNERIFSPNMALPMSDFDRDINFVRITLMNPQGIPTIIESKFFRATPRDHRAAETSVRDPYVVSRTVESTGPVITGRTDGLSFIEENISYLVGYRDGTFRPEAPMTRAEFATVLDRITEGGLIRDLSFIDVDESDWYYDSVMRMAGLGVAFTNSGEFRPGDYITRGEVASWLIRIVRSREAFEECSLELFFMDYDLGAEGLGLTRGLPDMDILRALYARVEGEEVPFDMDIVAALSKRCWEYYGDDFDIIGHYHEADIAEALSKGLMTVYDNGQFGPDNHVSRVEIVSIMNRLLGRSADETVVPEGMRLPPDMTPGDWGYWDVVTALNSYEISGERSETGHLYWR